MFELVRLRGKIYFTKYILCIGRMKSYLPILLSICPLLSAPWKAAFLLDYIEKFDGHSITIVTSSTSTSLSRKHLSQVTDKSIKWSFLNILRSWLSRFWGDHRHMQWGFSWPTRVPSEIWFLERKQRSNFQKNVLDITFWYLPLQ